MPTDEIFSLKGKRVWVAGHRGMVGSAIVRRLQGEDCEILGTGRSSVDLMNQAATRAWVLEKKPDAAFIAAAKVGGILANSTHPVDFLYDNLLIASNAIEAAHRAGIQKLIFLGSSCIYPRLAPQPIPESALLTGPLEPTNEWYAVAKIAGIKLCQAYRAQYQCDFISAMPTNLYGPGDNYDLNSSHVVPALIRKVHDAKLRGDGEVVLWGTGQPLREFLHVDDCADACVHLMKVYSGVEHVNVGSGEDLSVLDLAKLIGEVVGFNGTFTHDLSKPDGTPRKLMGVDKLRALGWKSGISLRDGLADTYRNYLAQAA